MPTDAADADRRRMSDAAPPRRIWLCADDYGLADGVNRAIRDLMERGRLNATSVMVVAPAHRPRRRRRRCRRWRSASPRCAIGLHVTLTAPFRPLTMHFGRSTAACSCRSRRLLRRRPVATARPPTCIAGRDCRRSSRLSRTLFGRAPDFVDGHQHVQLFPQVRDGFLARGEASCAAAPGCARAAADQPLARRLGAPQGAGARRPQRAIPPPRRRRRPPASIRPSPAPMILRRRPTSAR